MIADARSKFRPEESRLMNPTLSSPAARSPIPVSDADDGACRPRSNPLPGVDPGSASCASKWRRYALYGLAALALWGRCGC